MNQMLHDPSISETRKFMGYLISIIPCAMIFFSGMMKISRVKQIQEVMESIHLGSLTVYIGIFEIMLVILYWIPKTSNIGFFLLCSYVGGVIVAETSMGHGHISPLGIAVAILLYVGTMLRKPKLSGLNI